MNEHAFKNFSFRKKGNFESLVIHFSEKLNEKKKKTKNNWAHEQII